MQKNRILIVDDEPDIVEALQTRLEQENFECLTAYDGNGGLKVACAQKPDRIILDIMLPNLNGYKVCRLLKFQKELNRIPIVMLTAKDKAEDRLLGEQTGVAYFMTKPSPWISWSPPSNTSWFNDLSLPPLGNSVCSHTCGLRSRCERARNTKFPTLFHT